jgi:anti-anti-sigma factor
MRGIPTAIDSRSAGGADGDGRPVLLVAPPDCGFEAIPALAQQLSRLVASGFTDIVMDGRGVETVDEALSGLLVRTQRRLAERGGTLAVVADADMPIARSASGAGWDDVVGVFPTVESAVAGCHPEPPVEASECGWLGVQTSAARTLVTLVGEWDLSNVERLAAALEGVDERPGRILVDLGRATFIDVSVVTCLLRAQVACMARGTRLEVVGAQGEPLRAIRICGQAEMLLGEPE